MEINKNRTCRYCEWFKNDRCPFELARIAKKIDDSACGQFMVLKNVSMFKERKKIDQKILVQREEAKRVKGPLKRSIEF